MDTLIEHANYYWSIYDMYDTPRANDRATYSCAEYCVALRNALYAISREVCDLDARNIKIDKAVLLRAHKIAKNKSESADAIKCSANTYLTEYTICALDLMPLFLAIIERERLSICTLMSTAAAVH